MPRRTYSSAIRIAVIACVLSALVPTTTFAQADGAREPVPHDQVVTVNPFLTMFGWFNAEYERKLTTKSTWGLSGSFLTLDDGDTDYRNAAVLYRYYPQGAALSGFFFGGRSGVYHVSDHDDAGTYFGVGLDLGYNWLLGADHKFDVSIGFGVNRLFGADLDGVPLILPSVRLVNVGFAF